MRFDALKETLLQAGIAPRHVRRYLRELTDHLADLTEAQLEAGHDEATARLRARALLGGDEELAGAMLERPGLKSLPARAPWLVFGLLPPVVSLASAVLLVLPLVLISHRYHVPGHNVVEPGWFQATAQAVSYLCNFALGPAVAALMVWAATRQRLNGIWPLLASAIIALAGFHMTARFPVVAGHPGQITISALQPFRLIGVSWHLSATHSDHVGQPLNDAISSWTVLVQFFLTMAPALWLWRGRRPVPA